jgi:hypothetical protein
MFFEFFDLLLKSENFLFCGCEFFVKVLKLDFFFGHLRFDFGYGSGGAGGCGCGCVGGCVGVGVCVCIIMFHIIYSIFYFITKLVHLV